MPETEDFQLTAQLADFLRTRYFGKYRGTVADISDPEKLLRIKANVPAVFGEDQSPWAMPCVPYAGPQHGLVLLPEKGDGVWIEFEGGDLSRPIWSGCWWARNQVPSPQGDTVRILETSPGHQILIDEQNDEIKIVHPGGAEVKIGSSDITLTLGSCSLKITSSEVNINDGMVKVTTSGASLVSDTLKVGS